MNTIKLSPVPVKAWSWLNINDTELEIDEPKIKQYRKNPVPDFNSGAIFDNIIPEKYESAFPNQSIILEDTAQLIWNECNYKLHILIPKGVKIDRPIVIEFELDEAESILSEHIHITAEENSSCDFIIRYTNTGKSVCSHKGLTTLNIKSGAEIKLVKTQILSDEDTHIDAVYADVTDNARADMILCELGSCKTIAGGDINLIGEASSSDFDCIYLGDKDKDIDLNYRITFLGRESEGLISVKGALSDNAKKVLKSTVDFKRGALYSSGREEETVLVLSEKARNISSPLLLCGEDNVEGEHSTSTGRPDKAKLYYLMSRGFSEKDARVLLVEASFTPILDKIPQEEIRNQISSYIKKVVHKS